ncbi:MAG: hypothetical protein IJL66_02645 [Lachnospiraceae bacterium]|nr:hypothetical protein [Lachnospiraceae bacterium]
MSRSLESFLEGAIDLHEHLGPSVIPRKLNVYEGALQARAAGMRGILVKDHQFPSMASVEVARCVINDPNFFIGSCLVLNHETGGFNVAAVECAINMGVNMIWMPTISTQNHHDAHERSGLVFPASKKKIPTKPHGYIQLVGEDGNVVPACREVLKTIALDPTVVLGTGHGFWTEIDAIIRAAKEEGIQKIIVNHPTYMIDAPMDVMKRWTETEGVYLEFGVCTCDPEASCCNIEIGKVVEIIKTLGSAKLTLCSDYGQTNNPTPVEGLKHFIGLLREGGISDEDLDIMLKKNPAEIMGLN